MARFYTNENLALQVVVELRRLEQDVLTSLDAGNANSAVADAEVLSFARLHQRILLTHNRRHFLQLHQRRQEFHSGIVLCTFDPDFSRLAERILTAVRLAGDMEDKLIRVNRPAN